MKKIILLFITGFIYPYYSMSQSSGTGGRLNEVFQVTELTHPSPANTRFYDPWEVTYGPDDSLWITEAKGYKVYKMSPNGGTPRLILDISQNSSFLPAANQSFNLQFNFSGQGNPQGGLAGLAIHPNFLNAGNPKPYVFISYIWKYISTAPSNGGVFFQNSLVRFTYNFATGLLGNPVMVCDTLPGSSDHNSQRIIIAPVNGSNYLFYANGDMGAGQFGNASRTENAQNLNFYEGKILRFNLDPDGDADAYDQWIPSGSGSNGNPFNGTTGIVQSAVYGLGIRNNQGFAYAKINGTDYLYGQSHGPFSDDEINIIKNSGNYGHPLVIGYAADGNYDGSAAGNSTTYGGSLPVIGSEVANAAALPNYQDPIYTFYPAPKGTTTTTATVKKMYYDFNHGNQSNATWPSEAPSGLDIYTNSMIPGWKNSLVSSVLKGAPGTSGGRLLRLKLNSNGDGVITSASHNIDTTSYFGSVNRYRDLAFAPDGLSLFAIIDSSSSTSGPSATNPTNSKCKGCLLKFTFLGYADNGTTSTLPDTIDVATGATNTCVSANTVTINSANNNTHNWVPITDANSNVVAEIYANGNDLGAITTSYYANAGAVRETGYNHNLYLDRNITITPANQPLSAVKVRLYLTNTEFTTLKNATNSKGQPSGVTAISSLGVFKNHDACGPAFTSSPTALTASYFTRTTGAGANGFAIQASVTSFSTFYFANNTAPLTLHLLSFTGALINSIAQLQWDTENENGTKEFIVERSTDGTNFIPVGTVLANNTDAKSGYHDADPGVCNLPSTIVFYRLRIVDADGRFSFSDIVTFNIPGIAGSIMIHPNPVIQVATVEVNASTAESANWQLIDNMGRTIMQKGLLLVKGENTFTINASGLPAGVYYVKVTGTIMNQQVKFEKL